MGTGVKPTGWLGLESGSLNRVLSAGTTGGSPQMQHTALMVAIVSTAIRTRASAPC